MTLRCLADCVGPFVDPARPLRNWSAFPFSQIDRPAPPYVDRQQLERGLARAFVYLERLQAQGYTGIVIDNLAHLVGFEQAPAPIYAPDSPYRQRAAIYRAAFGRLFDAATARGMEVFVTADLQWSTPPLRRYVGPLRADNPRLAAVNCWALEELFTALPQVRGLVVRVGEAGGAHNQGDDYAGHMLYTTPHSLRHLIDILLPICERADRLLIVRTWSIGIGDLGDLLWSPERYCATFGGYVSPHLLVSVKHTPSDFFRLLPPNPTLGLPGPGQLIELQNRREYELFGMTPSSVADLHQEVLRRTATNHRFAGVWAWNATGGWGGGAAALGAEGWSVWTELSSALTAALLRDPDMETAEFVRAWCARALDGPFGAAVAELYLESADLIEHGWYSGSLIRGAYALGPIVLPSLLWVWWMRPTASLLIWAYLATAVDDRDAAIRRSAAAGARLAAHAARLAALAPPGDPRAAAIVASVVYLNDALEVAHALRTLLLRGMGAAWERRLADWRALRAEVAEVRARLRRHQETWAGRTDLPPLELDEIDALLRSFASTPWRIWFEARAACLLVSGRRPRRETPRRAQVAGVLAAALLLVSLWARGRRAGVAGVLASLLVAAPLRRQALQILLPWLNARLHLLPSIFFEAGPSLKEWTS